MKRQTIIGLCRGASSLSAFIGAVCVCVLLNGCGTAPKPSRPDTRKGYPAGPPPSATYRPRAGQDLLPPYVTGSKEHVDAAERGDLLAQTTLGLAYAMGINLPQDYREAGRWLRRAADQGYPQAQFNLGIMYTRGEGVPVDRKLGMVWVRKAAEGGLAGAQLALGLAFFYGREVPKDEKEAFTWLRKAADQGEMEAEHLVGIMCFKGVGTPQDDREALRWLSRSAAQGKANAQYLLGDFYAGGIGTSQDFTASTQWYLQAAEQGHPEAQFAVGGRYRAGRGVTKDEEKALFWLRRAAENGHSTAQATLGALCTEPKERIAWVRRAAMQGQATGQFLLGSYYMIGNNLLDGGVQGGLPRDHAEAYKWLSLAKAQGETNAAKGLELLSQVITSEQVAEGKRRAASFTPKAEVTEKDEAAFAGTVLLGLPRSCGSGFFVTEDGYLITNHHVVAKAARVQVKSARMTYDATVVKTDPVNDLAVLKVSGRVRALPITSSRGARLGESVFTVGFPNIVLQGIEPKLTDGKISSLAGARDDPRQFQISVAVQPGNSGGALVNQYGNVVGVVRARLSDAAALQASGALPQNVNYAVKSTYVLSLLQSIPAVAPKLKPAHPARERDFAAAVSEAQAAAVLVLVY